MSVVPMKLVTVAGPLQEFDSVISSCIINEQFHPESTTQIMKNVKFLFPFDQQNPYAELLRSAESLSEQLGLRLAYRNFEPLDCNRESSSRYFDDFESRYRALLDERDMLEKRIVEDEQIKLQLEHLINVNVPLQEFFSVTYVKFRFGRMPRDIYNSFIPHINERTDMFFFLTSVERDWVYGMYMMPRICMEKVDSLFASLQFERIRISGRVQGTGEQALKEIQIETEQAAFRLEEIKTELKMFVDKEKEAFLTHYSYVRFMNDSFNIRRFAAHTEESFYILGWVPEPYYEEFSRKLSERKNLTVVLVSDDPEHSGDYSPPILLKNWRIFRPFEPFVKMYGLPSYHEMDPTPLMALTYTLLFGIMFGDVGQGALLILAGLLMWKLKGMWLGKIICYAGVSSIAFGCIYGSVFGFEEILPGFKVLESSETSHLALMLAIYLGVGLLTMSFLVNIWNGIRQKNFEKMFFGSNSLAGLLLFVSIMSLILPILGFGEAFLPAGLSPILILAMIAVIFMRSPLSRLCARDPDWKPEKWSAFFVENIFELIEIVLSYVTNAISFLRVGAYAISHASMMMVVFLLAGPPHSESIVVIIIGNLVVMGIEGLLVGIQCLRLEFYEIFGRFYDGSGRSYSPIIIDYKSKNDDR